MSTGTVPIITCDDEYGCDRWEIDYHGMGASVPKLPEGWTGNPDDALCPECSRVPVHLIADGEAVTSCCGRTPFELGRYERITVDPEMARACSLQVTS